ncbi:MAG: hypothetical protein LBV50_07530 [Novosphingobium sp.]|nr:hypothetical protein [Novosphingobium sp.]
MQNSVFKPSGDGFVYQRRFLGRVSHYEVSAAQKAAILALSRRLNFHSLLSAAPMCIFCGLLLMQVMQDASGPIPAFLVYAWPLSIAATLIGMAVAIAVFVRSLRVILKDARPTSKSITPQEQLRATADGMSTGALALYTILALLLAATIGAWGIWSGEIGMPVAGIIMCGVWVAMLTRLLIIKLGTGR